MYITVAGFKGGVGKTTTAVHLACYLSQQGKTLLVDGDPNRSATGWGKRGNLPFQIVDLMAATKHSRDCDHVVIDTQARPDQEELEALADGCDLLVLPTTPDALAIDALLQTVDLLQALGNNRFKILLTQVHPKPVTMAQQARKALQSANLPIFKGQIRRLIAYEKATLEGLPVSKVKDRNAETHGETTKTSGRRFKVNNDDMFQKLVKTRSTSSSSEQAQDSNPTQAPKKRGRPANGKRSDPDWIGRTYYIQSATDLDVEEELLKLKREGIEIDKSELVNSLLGIWVKWRQGENSDILLGEISPRRK